MAYDVVVLMKAFPDLIPLWFNLMARRGLRDVQILERLDKLATQGTTTGTFSLEVLARKHLGWRLSKGEDTWRTRFGELDGVCSDDYPEEAAAYVKRDAEAARLIYLAQKKRKPEWLHTNASVCYFLKTARGLRVNRKTKAKLQTFVESTLDPKKLPLLFEGKDPLVTRPLPERPGLVKNHDPGCRRPPAAKGGCACPMKMLKAVPSRVQKAKVLIPRILEACRVGGLRVPRKAPTENEIKRAEAEGREPVGNVKTDDECLKLVAPFDPSLGQFATFKFWDKLRTSYFPAFEWPFGSGNTAPRVFCGYDYIKNTGRGSGRGNSKKNATGPNATALYPSVAIQLADPRVRPVYEPSKGFVFLIADYSSIDLVCLAQTIMDLYGSSTLADQINSGINPHTFLATVLAFETDRTFRKKIEGKSEAEGYAAFKAEEKAPLDKHTQPHDENGKCHCPNFYKRMRDLAKKVGLGFAGGMGLDTMISLCKREINLTITREQAKHYREIWFKVYPEMRWYLRKWVPRQVSPIWEERLCYTSPLGMVRERCVHTECANGRALQSPAAEGMKAADWLVTRACYDYTQEDPLFGSYPVINMHDELVLEVPESDPDTMNSQAESLKRHMVDGMKVVLPDLKVEAEPLLSVTWSKDAKQVRDEKGRITVWRPSPTEG